MRVIDLFAGAGGFSTGATMAGCQVVWAANHWQEAVDIHALNHPETAHLCQDLQQADWRYVPPHDFMLASPACQGHSNAKGKEKPHHDALRSTAWAVVSACEVHRKPFVLENVPEFLKWALFPAWSAAMAALGYSLSINVLDAADSGLPQHRKRLFIVGTRSVSPVTLALPERPYTAVSNVLDFNATRWSKIHKPGRAQATIDRWEAGRKQFGERFVMPFYSSGSGKTGRSIDRPIGTLTTNDRWMVVRGDDCRILSVEESRRIMGFPDNYQLPSRHRDAIKMLGNAVCPPHARDIINAVRAAI